MTAYPYSGQSTLGGAVEVSTAGAASPSTQVASSALQFALSTNSGSIDVLAYSGGASAFTEAYGQLSAADQQRIGTVLYISPVLPELWR